MLVSHILLLHTIRTEISNNCPIWCRFSLDPFGHRSWREQNVIQRLLKQPNLSLRPSAEDTPAGAPPPVIIRTSLHLESIGTVKEKNMAFSKEFKAQFRFQQEWKDDRLRFQEDQFKLPLDTVHLAIDQINYLWRPDTFFQNEKDGHYHSVDYPNFSFLIGSDGSIIYNRRMTLTFSCVMNFVKYPMDTQVCEINFASYAYTTSDIIYAWKDEPLSINQGAKNTLPNFVIRSFTNGTCSSITNTGEYSCLKIVVRLQRDFSFFLLQVYLPSTTLVAVAWLSYWIDWQATAARFPLVLVTLLTVVSQTHVISANLPPVSYIRAIDVWDGACVAFTFAALIEYAFVNYAALKQMKPRANDGRSPRRLKWTPAIRCGIGLPSQTIFSAIRALERIVNLPGHGGKFTLTSAEYDCRSDSFSFSPPGNDEEHSMSKRRTYSKPRKKRTGEVRRRVGDRQHGSIAPGVWMGHAAARLVRAMKARSRVERIDFVFRILYPLAFAMFNVVYWAAYW